MLRRVMMAGNAAGGGDPYWANVVSLLHFDGANNSTTIVDEAGASWTIGGAAVISTEKSRFGGSSLKLPGSSYLVASAAARFGFGTGDFTVECWVSSTVVNGVALDTRSSDSQAGVFTVNQSNKGNGIGYYQQSTGVLGGATASNDGNWHHYAWVRESGVFLMFQDGVKVYGGAHTMDFGASRLAWIGSQFNSGSAKLNGYIDEFRITKGVARYSENFTPPSAPFPSGP